MRIRITASLLLAALLAAALAWNAGRGGARVLAPEGAVLSLLAVGDTGQPPDPRPRPEPQFSVAEAMVAHDRAAPVDGLILLGDNFYPDGLREREFKDRVRYNVVQPYCHFLAFSPRGEGSLEEACDEDPAVHNPVPVYAVLGNHDYKERESPLLQRKRIPEYLPGWQMPEGLVEVFELEGGLSLIALQSMDLIYDEDPAPLVEALQRSKGPWRVIAAHHPMADPGRGYDRDYALRVAAAIRRAGVPVHLFLAGHEHNLQVLRRPAPEPPLHAVVGGGSDTRRIRESDEDRPYTAEAYGFARLDLVRARSGAEHLELTLFEVARRWPLQEIDFGPAARFAVRADGGVDALPPGGDGP